VIRRLSVLVLCALAPIVVVTGCGGGSSTTASKHATAPSKASSASLSARVAKAIRVCQQKEVRASPYIPVGEKPIAERDCEGVKSGNAAQVAALRSILKSACEEKVIAKVPAAEQAAATAACKKFY
jgi:hypothetical protein